MNHSPYLSDCWKYPSTIFAWIHLYQKGMKITSCLCYTFILQLYFYSMLKMGDIFLFLGTMNLYDEEPNHLVFSDVYTPDPGQ